VLLQSDLGQMRLEATPLEIAARGRQTAAQLASRGATFDVTGPAGRSVAIKALVAQRKAKALGLGSRTLGRGSGTIGADATGVVKVTLGRRAKRELRDLRGSLRVTFEALAGDRFASQSRRFSR
jgi:hypothetical protein